MLILALFFVNNINTLSLRLAIAKYGYSSEFQDYKSAVEWLKDNKANLTQAARSKLYVGLTRSRNSVAIVLKKSDIEKIEGFEVYNPTT